MGKMGLNSIVQNRNLQKCRLQEAIKNLEALADRNAVISLVDGEKRLRRKVMLEAERKLVAELMRKY